MKGILKCIHRKKGALILLTFENGTVKHNRKTLFEPTWGQYDMAVGESIVSAFSVPADPDGFCMTTVAAKEKIHKIEHNDQTHKAHSIYDRLLKLNFGKLKNIKKEKPELSHLIKTGITKSALFTKKIKRYKKTDKLNINIYRAKSNNFYFCKRNYTK